MYTLFIYARVLFPDTYFTETHGGLHSASQIQSTDGTYNKQENKIWIKEICKQAEI